MFISIRDEDDVHSGRIRATGNWSIRRPLPNGYLGLFCRTKPKHPLTIMDLPVAEDMKDIDSAIAIGADTLPYGIGIHTWSPDEWKAQQNNLFSFGQRMYIMARPVVWNSYRAMVNLKNAHTEIRLVEPYFGSLAAWDTSSQTFLRVCEGGTPLTTPRPLPTCDWDTAQLEAAKQEEKFRPYKTLDEIPQSTWFTSGDDHNCQIVTCIGPTDAIHTICVVGDDEFQRFSPKDFFTFFKQVDGQPAGVKI